MKYCSKCGHEHTDEVSVCTNCGFSLQAPNKKEKKGPKLRTSCIPLNIVNLFYALIQICALLFIILALAFPSIRAISVWGGYFFYYHPNYGFALTALILNGTSLLFSLLTFVVTLVFVLMKKAGNDYIFTALIQGALSFTLLGASISMFISSCGG